MQTDGTGFFACSLLITVLCIFPQWKASQSHGLCDCWCYRFFSEPCLHPFYLEPSCPKWAQQSAPPKDIVLHEPQTVLLWAVTFLDKELRSLSGSSVGASELLLWLRGIWGCVIWFNLLWHYQDVTPLCLVVHGYNYNTDNKLEAPDWLRYSPLPYWTHRAREPSRVE